MSHETVTPFVELAGGGLPWAALPAVPAGALVEATAAELARGGRLCAWFGVPDGTAAALVAVVAHDVGTGLTGHAGRVVGAAVVDDHDPPHLRQRRHGAHRGRDAVGLVLAGDDGGDLRGERTHQRRVT